MKLSKLLVSCVAAGALAAACTTAAFAADAVTATYADGKVTISGFQTYAGAVSGDLTLLILSEDTTVTSDNANNIIKQIDQFGKDTVTVAEDGTYSKEITVGTLDTANNKYYVRLGGAEVSDLYKNGFVATTFGGEKPKTVLIGDVDGDTEITAQDITEVAKNVVHLSSKVDDNDINYYAAAYADGDAEISAQDITEVAKNVVHLSTTYVGTTVDVGTYGTKTAQTVTE